MTSIKYGSLTIANISNSSGLFVGTNLQKGRKNEIVINEGFGTIKGKNRVKSNTGMVEKRS
ncbi:hypothetical protein L1999_12585 [Neobacillus drentensis]|uniref:hypothetical protein n=1 Tax=Neobacillus drentensis TaxID=220684 RepID=UPI001F4086CB|nr:hypothetical protein [Neobacillus drentensis]ULT59307.1 hypothetical protein L1999_12585 [Neobacillus drentensis]